MVVYLRKTGSQLVRQTVFEISGLRHSFEVIRLWEQPTSAFLGSPGLLPFAVLSQTEERTEVLQEVGRRIGALANRREQSNVMASAALLAGLVLEKELIYRVLRRDIMRESVIYRKDSERRVLLKECSRPFESPCALTYNPILHKSAVDRSPADKPQPPLAVPSSSA